MIWIDGVITQRLIIKFGVQLSNHLGLVFFREDFSMDNFFFKSTCDKQSFATLRRFPRHFCSMLEFFEK